MDSFNESDDFVKRPRLDPKPAAVLCPLCSKNLDHLTAFRRQVHTDKCLGKREERVRLAELETEWKETIDCPLCSKPLAFGPFRAAHVKSCAKQNGIPPADMLKLVDTQIKVARANLQRKRQHTSAAKPTREKVAKERANKARAHKLLPASQREEEEQLAIAISLSTSNSNSNHHTHFLSRPPKTKASSSK